MRKTFVATLIIPIALLWGQQIEDNTEEIVEESIVHYDDAIEEIESWR
jgi:hypothetical protein